MFCAPLKWLKASPIILSPATAGPPLLPGLIAASIWIRSPETGKLYSVNSIRETIPLVVERLIPPSG